MSAVQVCDVQGMCQQDGPVIKEKGEIQPTSSALQPCKQMDEDPGDSLDASSDGYDDDNSCRDEDDYYAFLREMAGSFEATYDDEDESDEGSEMEAEAEEEQPSGRKRWSNFWSEQRPASRTSASGLTTRTEEVKMDGSKDAFRGQIQAAQELKMGAAGARSQLKNSPGTPWSGSGSTGSTSAASPSDSNLSELSDSEDDRSPESSDCEDDSRPLVPTPSHDHRPPVVDSYDVVEAVKHFASQRTADPKEQQTEDKLTEIQIKESQMKQLRSSSKNMHFKPEVRAHYAKICKEIENEVAIIEASLSMLK